MRVHKKRATVKFMFHDPDDIRWFRPVEVYTRNGRRGRITEPIGARQRVRVQLGHLGQWLACWHASHAERAVYWSHVRKPRPPRGLAPAPPLQARTAP